MTAPAPRLHLRPIGIAVLVVAALLVAIALRRSGGDAADAEVATQVAVHVGHVTRATLLRYVTAYGYVEAAPARDSVPGARAQISPITGGVVVEIRCVEGGRVAQGALLFRLDDRLARVAVERARQEVEYAEAELQRQRQLLPAAGTSQRAFQEAQQRAQDARSGLDAAETQLGYLRITAPLSGTVVRIDAVVGQYAAPGTVLAEIVDLGRLVVAADVPTQEAEALRPAQRVTIGPDSAGVEGTLTLIGREVNPRTGTRRVQVSVPARAGLVPGDFAAIRIASETRRDVLAVPEVSLVTRAGEGSWIAVVQGNRAVRRPVTPGLRDAGLVEVAGDGIAEGLAIVLDEAYSLPEDTKVRVVDD